MSSSEPAPVERARAVAEMVASTLRGILGPQTTILWFGSWPRGDAAPRSDIDVAYRAGGPVTPGTRVKLRMAVEDLPTLYSVDLVDLDEVGPDLHAAITRDGQAL